METRMQRAPDPEVNIDPQEVYVTFVEFYEVLVPQLLGPYPPKEGPVPGDDYYLFNEFSRAFSIKIDENRRWSIRMNIDVLPDTINLVSIEGIIYSGEEEQEQNRFLLSGEGLIVSEALLENQYLALIEKVLDQTHRLMKDEFFKSLMATMTGNISILSRPKIRSAYVTIWEEIFGPETAELIARALRIQDTQDQ